MDGPTETKNQDLRDILRLKFDIFKKNYFRVFQYVLQCLVFLAEKEENKQKLT